MKVNINKDMTRFKREKGNGMKTEDIFKIVISLLVTVGIMCVFYFIVHIPVFISVFLTLVPAVPVCLILFFNDDNGGFIKYVKSEIEYFKGDKKLVYQSISFREFNKAWNGITEKEATEDAENNNEEPKKQNKLVKFLLPDLSFMGNKKKNR